MKVFILRGLPGSGKTSWAQKHYPDAPTFSADRYHEVEGEYKYDPRRAGEAHDWCLSQYLYCVQRWHEVTSAIAVVDNTNTTLMELAAYVRIAQIFNCDVKIIQFHCTVEESVRRNIHRVPYGTILRMNRDLFNEVPPPYWPIETGN